ncbi:hypothetical protein Tsubulata_014555 [Turnera subulata]|uniref:RST domain-containing protein n=1 Tax=Turnera subulata TaxID=218843 RepID=A0A9Q0J878_9ROSI|nr:hypothetical protein Tsubulata_014555 [Turnera subulata]
MPVNSAAGATQIRQLQQQQKQQLSHFPQTPLVNNVSGGNCPPYTGINVNMDGSSAQSQPQLLQMRSVQRNQSPRATPICGAIQPVYIDPKLESLIKTEMQLQTLSTKFLKNEIAGDQFIRLMRNIIGDQTLRLALLQWKSQSDGAQYQFSRQYVRVAVNSAAVATQIRQPEQQQQLSHFTQTPLGNNVSGRNCLSLVLEQMSMRVDGSYASTQPHQSLGATPLGGATQLVHMKLKLEHAEFF